MSNESFPIWLDAHRIHEYTVIKIIKLYMKLHLYFLISHIYAREGEKTTSGEEWLSWALHGEEWFDYMIDGLPSYSFSYLFAGALAFALALYTNASKSLDIFPVPPSLCSFPKRFLCSLLLLFFLNGGSAEAYSPGF
ncbi:hypothetical protein KP509_07G042900 [Ceratopteris richardii]|uniref:Uncharacterized protein n=1 Tax=Ceratopteris richardii TaxID=49495 RepID=A0A8T2UGD0_CERRI|nr:hypothetical protein KP509_07G042900 [Ceratopteris richardii]